MESDKIQNISQIIRIPSCKLIKEYSYNIRSNNPKPPSTTPIMDIQPNQTYNDDSAYSQLLSTEQCIDKLLNLTLTYNNNTHITIQCYLPMDTSTQTIDLGHALDILGSRNKFQPQNKIFYVNYSTRMNQFLGIWPFKKEVRIKVDSLANDKLELFCMTNEQSSKNNVSNQVQKTKTRATKQRTIGEAMEAVRQWRILYDTSDPQGRRRLYTLDEAAQRVGIPKKSLDDYFNHMQIARQHNFNFERYKQEKMGLLRKFVKAAKALSPQILKQSHSEYILEQDIQKYWNLESNY